VILPRRNRVAALAIVFAVLFVVAVALQALIVVPLVAAEEGPLDALEAVRRAWGVFHPWHGDAVVGLELVGIAAAIAGTQVAFVAPLVGRPSLSASGHSLRASVVAAIFMALFLTGGLLFALLQGALLAVADPGQSTSFEHLELLGEPGIVAVALVLVWIAAGACWCVVLWSSGSARDPNGLQRFVRWILAGTAVELALSIPLYALARRNESCYCSLPTFWSILVGTTALFWLCGPWAVLFLTRRFRRDWSRGSCPACGYPRRTGATVCSECGGPFQS